ncbi:hypothetical protein BD309DRAFT_993991 [Dichomitus squalens]|uniref:Uncharacterized protein n=1 Tax=Dichomitus squalens TaxID=114155 RepID=A0A4Q9PER3_9APHY|nr:hypothetical protein BD311DRAFT_774074 [Dichomitus squalens]TBU39111.1 hypothetical protein BD309DRAFT_993991 [Dichomitus squalens]TBU53379.1 hypothetical protein BD310DRAFT_952139 [Dichomitus squalens]
MSVVQQCRPPTPPLAPSTPINVPHGMFKFKQYASDAYTVPAWLERSLRAGGPGFRIHILSLLHPLDAQQRRRTRVHPRRDMTNGTAPLDAVLLFARTRAFSAKRTLLEDLCSADMMARCMKASQYPYSRVFLEIPLW